MKIVRVKLRIQLNRVHFWMFHITLCAFCFSPCGALCGFSMRNMIHRLIWKLRKNQQSGKRFANGALYLLARFYGLSFQQIEAKSQTRGFDARKIDYSNVLIKYCRHRSIWTQSEEIDIKLSKRKAIWQKLHVTASVINTLFASR